MLSAEAIVNLHDHWTRAWHQVSQPFGSRRRQSRRRLLIEFVQRHHQVEAPCTRHPN